MAKDGKWYALAWVVPAAPSDAASFVREGPYATREEAVEAARAMERAKCGERFVRVIKRAEAPTGEVWDEAEELDR